MHVIPIAGGDPILSVVFVWLVLWLCVFCLFGLLCCFWFAFLSVFLLGQLLDCVLVRNRHFCGFRQVDSPACKLQFNCLPRLNVCNDLAEAMKALDGKKMLSRKEVHNQLIGSQLIALVLLLQAQTLCKCNIIQLLVTSTFTPTASGFLQHFPKWCESWSAVKLNVPPIWHFFGP